MSSSETGQKHCSRLWNGLMIRQTGHVYPCCQLGNRPELSIGDLAKEPLTDIINNERIRQMRRESLEGRLGCYDQCEQVKFFEGFPIPKPEDDITNMSWYADLQIEYGELCNVDCVMCWQDRTNQTQLGYDFLKENLPLESWKSITVYGGEVFVMKDALRHVHDILDRGKKNVVIITNGKALSNVALATKIVEKGSGLNVSINAVTEATHSLVMRPPRPFFDLVLANMRQLQEIKLKVNRPDFRINGQFTAVKESLHEIPIFIETFRDMGFDSATITFDHRHFPHFFDEDRATAKTLGLAINRAFERTKFPEHVVLAEHGKLKAAAAE